MTVNKNIPICYKLFYWPVNSASIYCSLSNCWPRALFYIPSISHYIDITMVRRCPDSRTLMDMWVERVNKTILKKMKMYNKTVIDWLLWHYPRTDQLPSACSFGQHIHPQVKQICCCPRTQSITVYYCSFCHCLTLVLVQNTFFFIYCMFHE